MTPHAKELENQPTWLDLQRCKLKDVPKEFWLPAPVIQKQADCVDDAILIVKEAFFVGSEDPHRLDTVVGEVCLRHQDIHHIVEKRLHARERYASFAYTTVKEPYEVWKTKYDNGDHGFSFVSLFDSKYQLVVKVRIWDEHVLWNFFHCETKSANKHRKGELMFSRN
ncbi:PBECR2 nuclease fold domain-containing protein [Vibrio harveyi]|uniref:PBECR2 nuclease fold domain-containing protein n=1 Tax=Vibrio harveyi TaxID=669 RepID=UPI002380AD82|nr:PBECR2 nuclease fold domain-containing protein [Vibrio harveyi]